MVGAFQCLAFNPWFGLCLLKTRVLKLWRGQWFDSLASFNFQPPDGCLNLIAPCCVSTFIVFCNISYFLHRRLTSGEGIVSLGVTQSVCVSAELRLHAELVSAAKVMRCIQCCLVVYDYFQLAPQVTVTKQKYRSHPTLADINSALINRLVARPLSFCTALTFIWRDFSFNYAGKRLTPGSLGRVTCVVTGQTRGTGWTAYTT